MGYVVFVSSIKKTQGGIEIEASNGSQEGPPFARFVLPPAHGEKAFIGKRYSMNIEEA